MPVNRVDFLKFGGADGNQTHDLFIANEALYQLSYCPKNKGPNSLVAPAHLVNTNLQPFFLPA